MADTLLYLNIDFDGKSVRGESAASDYANRIEVESFHWTMTAKHTDDLPDRKGNTEVLPDRLEITKYYDKSSTVLAKYMNEQKPFKFARLQFAYLVISDQSTKQVMRITLTDGYVEKIMLRTSSGDSMQVGETVSLSFTKLDMQYHPHVLSGNTRSAAMNFFTQQPTAR